MTEQQLYAATEIVRVSRDGTGREEIRYENVRPSTGTLEEYLEPAARFLLHVIMNDMEPDKKASKGRHRT